MEFRTVILTLDGYYAEFWAQTYLVNGEPHILDVYWSQPGDEAYEAMKRNHALDGTLIRRNFNPATGVTRGWFLNGNADKIQDAGKVAKTGTGWSNVPNVDFRGTTFS